MSLADELRALKERSATMVEVSYQESYMRAISIDIANQFAVHMGYEFDLERIQRIADEARFAMSEGVPAAYAFSHALNLELVMYGDPNDKTEYVGVLGTSIAETL